MDFETLHKTLEGMAKGIEYYAIPLAALGVLTMALIEVFHKLTNALARFHQKAINAWLQAEARTSDSLLPAPYAVETCAVAKRADQPYHPESAYAELLHLSTGAGLDAKVRSGLSRRIEYALFDLELARMMSQVQDASEAAINNPERYPHLFTFLTRSADSQDVATWRELRKSNDGGRSPGRASVSAEQQAAVYGRLRLLMRRQLDAFQTVTAYRWREWNQFAAWLLGFILMLVALLTASKELGTVQVVASLLGGIFAPLAKDLVTALANVKRK